MHDLKGVFIASGPAFRNGGYYEGATILDIAPTALAVMGLPVAEDMDGRVLEEIIRDDHLKTHPVSSIPSYESVVGRRRGEIGSAMDESIRDQLRSLGYIE
jgi:arylsulfatase A-like enzyme